MINNVELVGELVGLFSFACLLACLRAYLSLRLDGIPSLLFLFDSRFDLKYLE